MPHTDRPSADRAAASPQLPEPPAVPFEVLLSELNDLVNRLESGGLGLSDSIGAYERGVVILRQLHEQLADVETRVRMLVRIDENGHPVLEDIGDGATASGKAERHAMRSSTGDGGKGTRRTASAVPRTGRPKTLPGMDDGGEDG